MGVGQTAPGFSPGLLMSVEDVYLIIPKILTMQNISHLPYSITLRSKVEGYSSVTPAFRPGILSQPLTDVCRGIKLEKSKKAEENSPFDS